MSDLNTDDMRDLYERKPRPEPIVKASPVDTIKANAARVWHQLTVNKLRVGLTFGVVGLALGLAVTPGNAEVIDRPVPGPTVTRTKTVTGATVKIPGPTVTVTVTAEPPPPAQPLSVSGRASTVTQIGATLTGRYKIDYTTQDNAFIAHFLRADGTRGDGLFGGINELDFDRNVSGSTIATLDHVTMVETDNIDNAWTITFTPL